MNSSEYTTLNLQTSAVALARVLAASSRADHVVGDFREAVVLPLALTVRLHGDLDFAKNYTIQILNVNSTH